MALKYGSTLQDRADEGFLDLNNSSPFDILPIEVISHILGHLPYRDLKSARLVSKQWYLASLNPKLINKDELVIRPQRNFSIDFFNGTNEDILRDFVHLLVEEASSYKLCSFWENDKFWLKVGPNLKSFTLEEAGPGCSTRFAESLRYCPNLQNLYFRCDERAPGLDLLPFSSLSPSTKFSKIPGDLPTLVKLKRFSLFGHCQSDKELFYKVVYRRYGRLGSDYDLERSAERRLPKPPA